MKKILIADSDPMFAENLAKSIGELGDFEASTALDGQEALKKARKERPDLIVIEDALVSVDGFKLCRLLKFDKRMAIIPIILLAAELEEAGTALAEEVDADEYLLKSDNKGLLDKIKEYLAAVANKEEEKKE